MRLLEREPLLDRQPHVVEEVGRIRQLTVEPGHGRHAGGGGASSSGPPPPPRDRHRGGGPGRPRPRPLAELLAFGLALLLIAIAAFLLGRTRVHASCMHGGSS
jgi:hypothetical protein